MKTKPKFSLHEFANRGGSSSWRVAGIDRHGKRVRMNFGSLEEARVKQVELESDYLGRKGPEVVRATTLTEQQVELAQVAFLRLDADVDILPAVEHWLRVGKQERPNGDVRLDDAVEAFKKWLADTPELREKSKINLRSRVGIFAGQTGNLPLAAISPEKIEAFLESRRVSATTRDNDRRALSRFFKFCAARPRHWLRHNPCSVVTVEMPEAEEPKILTVDECQRLLDAAQGYKDGKLLGYIALGLFGGLRPFEAARLKGSCVNLADGEIRIEAATSKVKRTRTIEINPTLRAWLSVCDLSRPFAPGDWDNELRAIRKAAAIQAWPADVLRHTGVSHFWRQTGSYGLTAQWAGNSEEVIRDHYQARVSTADTARFYAIRPTAKPA
jgi:integrase